MGMIEVLLVLYVLIIIVTILFAAKKKTSWFSIFGVIFMPIYFLFVLWDVFRSAQREEKPQAK